jgi:hypothetical protein
MNVAHTLKTFTSLSDTSAARASRTADGTWSKCSLNHCVADVAFEAKLLLINFNLNTFVAAGHGSLIWHFSCSCCACSAAIALCVFFSTDPVQMMSMLPHAATMTVLQSSGRCTWPLCSLGPASGNGVHGLFSLHGHHLDLVNILSHLEVYSTRIHCLSRCRRLRWHVSPFYSHRVHGARLRRRSLELFRSTFRLLYSAGVISRLFYSSSNGLSFCCTRLHFCILSTFEFQGIL